MMVEDMWLMASDGPFPSREDVNLFLRRQLPGRPTPAFDEMDEAERPKARAQWSQKVVNQLSKLQSQFATGKRSNLTLWDSALLRKCDAAFVSHFTPNGTLVDGYGTKTPEFIKLANRYAEAIHDIILKHPFDVPADQLVKMQERFACRAYYGLCSYTVRLPLATESSFLVILDLMKKSEAALGAVSAEAPVLTKRCLVLIFKAQSRDLGHTHIRRGVCVYAHSTLQKRSRQ